MTYPQKIMSLWVVSASTIIVSVIISYQYQSQIEHNNKSYLATLPVHNLVAKSDVRLKSEGLGRRVIAEIYHTPSLINGAVLGEQTPPPQPLKQEEISDIATSTVVRVFNKVEGTVTFPEFNIDLFHTKLVPTGTNYTDKAKSLITGTGFFVDSNGHILTNSHVVDKSSVLDDFILNALDYYGNVLTDQLAKMDPKTKEELRNQLIAQYGGDPLTAALYLSADIEAGIKKYIKEKATVNAVQTITILDEKSDGTIVKTEDDLLKLVDKGTPATLVDWKPDYATSNNDVALLKVDSSTTPFLTLNGTDKIGAGQQIYIIGFPQNATLDDSDLFSRTLTQGTISSLKNINGTQVYQTDAKISQGSSGSPMINDKGEVVGIITYLTSGSIGDSFGFAIPIDHALTLMKDNGLVIDSNPYMSSFVSGLGLAQQNLCRKANLQFASSQNLDQTFSNPNLQKYVDRCNDVIAAGNSKEGIFYGLSDKIKAIPIFVVGGLVGLFLISIGAFFLIRKFRHAQVNQQPAFGQ